MRPLGGLGGVPWGVDAAQLLVAGAPAVGVGTALFADPFAPLKVRDRLAELTEQYGLARTAQLTGGVLPW